MLLGGLVMVTPKSLDTVVLANPFTNLPVHVAATGKCIQFLASRNPVTALPEKLYQDPESVEAPEIDATTALVAKFGSLTPPLFDEPVVEDARQTRIPPDFSRLPPIYASAGVFTLSEDVTAKRNPRLISTSKQAIASLPYKVLATDILLEGLGWVELTAQVRNRRDTGYQTVDVEIYTPEGKGVGQRRTMSAYTLLEEGARSRGLLKKTARPRKSMKGQKKLQKMNARQAALNSYSERDSYGGDPAHARKHYNGERRSSYGERDSNSGWRL
jgi:hypothetical protein